MRFYEKNREFILHDYFDIANILVKVFEILSYKTENKLSNLGSTHLVCSKQVFYRFKLDDGCIKIESMAIICFQSFIFTACFKFHTHLIGKKYYNVQVHNN